MSIFYILYGVSERTSARISDVVAAIPPIIADVLLMIGPIGPNWSVPFL
jgi:hypothetical protein